MKKVLTLLFMVSLVSIGARADCTITKAEAGQNNGKGFTYPGTVYVINVETAGDLANANIDEELKSSSFFTFKGKLNSSDLAKIKSDYFGKDANGDIYIDLADVTFDDDASFSDFNHGTVKYLIMPNNTKDIQVADFDPNIMEAMVVNETDKVFLLYSSPSSSYKDEHVLAFDNRWKNSTATTVKLIGTYKDVFGEMKFLNSNGNLPMSPETLDLTKASFPTFVSGDAFVTVTPPLTNTYTNDDGGLIYSCDVSAFRIPNVDGTDKYTGHVNGLAYLNLWKTVKTILLPTDAKTNVLPSMSLYNLTGLTGTFTIPSNFTEIGALAFNVCSNIECVEIQGNNKRAVNETKLGPAVFASMSSLSEIIMPSTIKVIPRFAFSDCSSLKIVNLPEGIETLEYMSFGCTSGEKSTRISSIRLPNTLKRIESNAFTENHHLTTITIPENVEYIGTNAFANCNNLMDVYFMGTETIPQVAADAFDATSLYNDNSIYSILVSGNNVCRESYTHTGNFYRNTNNENDQCMAVMHYPVISQAAEYAEMIASDVTAYNRALKNENAKMDIYFIEGDKYVLCTGVPEQGTTYYSMNYKKDDKVSSTTSAVNNVEVYYSDAECKTSVNPTLSETYYYECGTQNTYSEKVWGPINGIGTYYKKLDNGEYVEAPFEFQDWPQLFYKSGDEYLLTKYYINGVTDYYTQNYDNLTYKIFDLFDTNGNYKGGLFKDGRYYVTGTKPTYCPASEYKVGTTYYIKENDTYTEATNISFAETYYYYPQVENYTLISDNTIIEDIKVLRSTKPYTKEGDVYSPVVGELTEVVKYYNMTKEYNPDIYGQYYTDLERNSKYTGVVCSYDSETKEYTPLGVDYKWPLFAEYEYGKTYGDDPYAGLKNFRLVAGYAAGEEAKTKPTTPLPRLDRDMWYTIYLPADLTRQQIYDTFGPRTQVCRFLGMRKNETGSFVIDFSVDMLSEKDAKGNLIIRNDWDVAMKAYTPYMIYPSVAPSRKENGEIIPVEFRIVGAEMAADDKPQDYYGLYDGEKGERKAQSASQNYLTGYKFTGTVEKQERKDFCYYFGNIWEDDDTTSPHKKYPKLQAFWSYEGSEKEGWNLTINACTAYIVKDDSQSSKPSMASLRFGVSYEDDPIVTNISIIEEESISGGDDRYDNKIYNLNGQYVGDVMSTLSKGVYIKNGKKYIVR
ncbi:MAG: leucine-rich repeat domain-containing protein [Prevotella sp.]|nr:leucine-rich repeat domain-containing protein [Prevotella sp.]